MKMTIEGEIHFTDDDADIKSVSPDGFLSIDRRTRADRHIFEVRSSRHGTIERNYVKDGKVEAWGPTGKAWLAQILPQLIRDTPIDAPARVKRIRRLKGEAGVLDEISMIRSDGAKRIYFQELFTGGILSADLLTRAASQIGNEIHSDGDKREVLKQIATSYFGSADLSAKFFTAERTIHSDGDRKSLLTSVLTSRPATSTLKLAIESSATINSDGDKTAVLIEAISVSGQDEALHIACLVTADTIHSDGDHRRVLEALLNKPLMSDDGVRRTLQSAAKISSDGDKASVLVKAAAIAPNGDAIASGFLSAAKTINSDGDKTRVLVAYLQRDNLSANTVRGIQTLGHREIHSDGDRQRLQKVIDQKYPASRQ